MALGNLAQGNDGGLVVFPCYPRIGTGVQLPGTLGRHQYQLEAVFHVIETVFYGDASHALTSNSNQMICAVKRAGTAVTTQESSNDGAG